MPEGIAPENLLSSVMETLSDTVQKQKSSSYYEAESSNSVSVQFNKLFGREKPVYHVLGGGKSADVLLWRNKKISASVLTGATAIWVLFEWLNYHLLSLAFFALFLGMLALFAWSNASSIFNRNPSKVPRIRLPEDVFANIGVTVGREINRFLGFLQDVASGGNLKQFVLVVVSLWVAAVIGSWCNFLTVVYIGFVAAHTLPVLYERYDDQIDDFVYKFLDRMQHQYRKIDYSVLSRIPTRNRKGKKWQ